MSSDKPYVPAEAQRPPLPEPPGGGGEAPAPALSPIVGAEKAPETAPPDSGSPAGPDQPAETDEANGERRAAGDGIFGLLIPMLASLVALVALGSTIYLDMQNRARSAAVLAEIARLQSSVEALTITAAEPPLPNSNDGTIEALLALQERVRAVEEAVAAAAAEAAAARDLALPGSAPLGGETALADGPTEDCIPIGTRFVALPQEGYPICLTPEVITVNDISGDAVVIEGAGTVVEGGFQRLGFSDCTVMVLSADVEGFAELRVSCG